MEQTAAIFVGLVCGYIGWHLVLRLPERLAKFILEPWGGSELKVSFAITYFVGFAFVLVCLTLILLLSIERITTNAESLLRLRQIAFGSSLVGWIVPAIIATIEKKSRDSGKLT
jgi:hypothetical protein